jgi:murein L,D-transpeptidase YcbB/YkuD
LSELRGNSGNSKKASANNATIETILVNMERWRWLPNDLGPFYVNVNVPEFVVRVVDNGKVIHQAHVVVGKTNKPTPIFSDEMTEVVFNPVWNVPSSVKTEEILPWVMRSGGGGLFGGGWSTRIFEINNLHVRYRGREVDPRTIDWGRIDIRNLEIYQPPGRGNVLGHVKFVFPNEHDVYMHDTTEKNYYGQPYRAVSHGCVRVQNPDQLALVILRHDQNWTQERVASAFRGSGDNHVALEQKIPVYISYFTLRVNDDGSISTFRDIYGHDARMMAALNRKNVFDAPIDDNRIAATQKKQFTKRDRRVRPPTNNFALTPFGF